MEILPSAKKIYKKLFQSKRLDQLINAALNFLAGILACAKGMKFPAKFNWEWKLEMLLNRYEKTTTVFFRETIKPGMNVVDIGAHIGYYTILFSKLTGPTGQVYAFEADKDNFALLAENTKKRRNIILINKALADKNGEIEFYKINQSTGCHSIVLPQSSYTKISVPSITLDSFAQSNRLKNIDVIKIDIEGGEPFAFQGMETLFRENKNLIIVSEFSPQSLSKINIRPVEFLKKIRGYGFEISQISETGGLKKLDIENLENLDFYKTGYTNLVYSKRPL